MSLVDRRPSTVVALVLERLRAEGTLASETIRSWTHVMSQFARYAEAGHGISDIGEVDSALVEGFLEAPSPSGRIPGPSVRLLRRSSLRCLYRTARRMGLTAGDPTLDVTLPSSRARWFRPLEDEEIELCRAISLAGASQLTPVLWALAEATARTGEMPAVTRADVALDEGRVWLAGTAATAPRWAELTDWGTARTAQYLQHSRGAAAVPLLPSRTAGESIGASTLVSQVTRILTRAGLPRSAGVRPASIAAWVGRKVFDETGRIDLVAARCGMRSLDAAARLIDWAWDDPDG